MLFRHLLAPGVFCSPLSSAAQHSMAQHGTAHLASYGPRVGCPCLILKHSISTSSTACCTCSSHKGRKKERRNTARVGGLRQPDGVEGRAPPAPWLHSALDRPPASHGHQGRGARVERVLGEWGAALCTAAGRALLVGLTSAARVPPHGTCCQMRRPPSHPPGGGRWCAARHLLARNPPTCPRTKPLIAAATMRGTPPGVIDCCIS